MLAWGPEWVSVGVISWQVWGRGVGRRCSVDERDAGSRNRILETGSNTRRKNMIEKHAIRD